MKNSIKIIILLLIVAAGIFVYSQKANAPVISEESVVGTYIAHGSKDVYKLEITSEQGEAVMGTLDIKNYQKDSSNGPIVGTFRSGILLADYTFQSEGTTSVNQVIFKRMGNDFVRGYGELNASGTRFADPGKATFDSSSALNVYKKVPPGADIGPWTDGNSSSTVSSQSGGAGGNPRGGAAQGKLNIDAVCQGALAYMTFKDGASAGAFVSECKEGKHPEVIERYKADMNLGDGARI